MIEVNNLKIAYESNVIISDISFSVQKSEILAIVGSSGSGKSSILHAIGMLIKPQNGTIKINDHINVFIKDKIAQEILEREVAFIFQDFLLDKNKTVKENLELIKYNDTYNVNSALSQVEMEQFIDYPVYKLSGGQQQRVAIARLLMRPFSILLGDEITGSLDSENQKIILNLIRTIANNGASVILVTHSDEVAAIADKVVDLDEWKN